MFTLRLKHFAGIEDDGKWQMKVLHIRVNSIYEELAAQIDHLFTLNTFVFLYFVIFANAQGFSSAGETQIHFPTFIFTPRAFVELGTEVEWTLSFL